MGRYCHHCGQDILAGRNTSVFGMLYTWLENVFSFDRKIPRTYFYLLFRPGFLSLEYINGRIARYVHPTKLIWFIVIVFFAVTLSFNNVTKSNKDSITTESTIEDELEAEEDEPNTTFNEMINHVSKNGELYKGLFFKLLPYLAFIFIPCYAFLMRLFFGTKKHTYLNQLIFSVHLYAFFFLLMLVYYIYSKLLGVTSAWELLAMLVIPVVYYFAAIRAFYHSRYIGVFIKGGLVFILNGLLMLTAFILFLFGFMYYIYLFRNAA